MKTVHSQMLKIDIRHLQFFEILFQKPPDIPSNKIKLSSQFTCSATSNPTLNMYEVNPSFCTTQLKRLKCGNQCQIDIYFIQNGSEIGMNLPSDQHGMEFSILLGFRTEAAFLICFQSFVLFTQMVHSSPKETPFFLGRVYII